MEIPELTIDTHVKRGAEESRQSLYRDTPLPPRGENHRPLSRRSQAVIPEKMREFRRMFCYGRESMESKAANFHRQAKFMEDYEDEFPWKEGFFCYYPTYADLTTNQLRAYFSWRAHIRRGEFLLIPISAVYLYIYELLNGVGADSPLDSLIRLDALRKEIRKVVAGRIDELSIGRNLRRWMLELSVVHNVPPELAKEFADPEILKRDEALSALLKPAEHTDKEVFEALCHLGGEKIRNTPVLKADPERGMRLFKRAWEKAASGYTRGDKNLFTLCFGRRMSRQWFPLANALFDWTDLRSDRSYELDESRFFTCRGGRWQINTYEKLFFDRALLQEFLREADLMFRRYLKTGRYLRENGTGAWVRPFLEAVIKEDRKEREEAARPKITIDLTGLDRIREDAGATRDSLLTEEEREETGDGKISDQATEETVEAGEAPSLSLDAIQRQILDALLRGDSTEAMLRANHLMPSIAADALNEALFDEIGDVAVLCEDDRLSLAEDYREDLAELLGKS